MGQKSIFLCCDPVKFEFFVVFTEIITNTQRVHMSGRKFNTEFIIIPIILKLHKYHPKMSGFRKYTIAIKLNIM